MVKGLYEMQPVKYAQYNYLESLTYMVKERNYIYAIYGAGRDGKMVRHWIEKVYHLAPEFFIDKNGDMNRGGDVSILSVSDFVREDRKNVFVVIAVGEYTKDEDTRKEIDSVMEEAGVKISCDAEIILRPFKKPWWHYISSHANEFESLFEELQDAVSKETLEEYLKTYVLGQRYGGRCFPEEYKYWGIDTEAEKLFQLSEREVVLNIGACQGDTLIQYLKCKNPYQKFIAVEADERNFSKLCRIVNCLGEEDRKKIQTDMLFLGEGINTIDQRYKEERISFINMDIEGSEMAVLETAKDTISSKRPILAVCAYHKMEDLVVIPEFIRENFHDYVFALRKYPSSWWEYIDGIHQINELVLYAIPEERYCKEM